jgi:hypothetical protein|tara:strand:- start:1131 stop:1907 length:777 start_codon:yes stop_codon:yes gene_type:complete
MQTAGILLLALEGASAFTAGMVARPAVVPRVAMDSVTCMASPWDMSAITPDGKLKQRVQGKTRKTWQFNNVEKDRVQVALASEGRPVKAEIQLWIGPDWTPFTLKAYSEDGKKRPINTLVGTRNKAAMIEVRNEGEYEFPFDAAANYAQGPMAALALDIPKGMPDAERVDGGAVRSNVLESATERLEVVLNTEGRQLNARIELLAGPNNPKQMFEVFTNNGELNSLCVSFNTIEAGNTFRIVNLAPLEFPLYYYTKEV